MDMLPSKYIRVNYFWPKSARKSFCVWRMSKKLKKFCVIKSILIMIFELCQHLGSLRSLWKAPETKTWGGVPPLYKVGLKTIDTISNCSSIFRCVSISITGCVRKSRTFVKINQHIKEIQTLETNKGIEVMKTKLVKKVIMFEKVKKTNEG